MGTAITVSAAVFLILASVYVLTLILNDVRATAIAQRGTEAERDLFQARIADIRDRRTFEREKNEFSWNGHRKFEVYRKVEEGGGIFSFYLRPHDKKSLPPFEPGQFLTFRLDIPGETKPVIRCYSLSDSAKPDYYRVSIKKLPPPRDRPELPPGKSSSYFHDQVQEGDILDVKAPGGHFYVDMTKHTPVVLIGGGVGVTPVLSMLNAIVASGSQRETWFFLGVRNGKEHIMKEHLERVARENANVHLHVCYSNPADKDKPGEDYHHAERVGVDLFKTLLPSNNYSYYFCGPPPMMNALAEGLEAWGVPEKNIHYEAFGPATVKKLKKAAPPPAADASAAAIEVTFVKSGKTIAWESDAGSLLDFAEAHGVSIDSGCRAGNCGTCITAVQGGSVDYVTEPGEMPEAGSCLTCISVPKENLKLDA